MGVFAGTFLGTGLATSGLKFITGLRTLAALVSGSTAGVDALRLAVQSLVLPTRPT